MEGKNYDTINYVAKSAVKDLRATDQFDLLKLVVDDSRSRQTMHTLNLH